MTLNLAMMNTEGKDIVAWRASLSVKRETEVKDINKNNNFYFVLMFPFPHSLRDGKGMKGLTLEMSSFEFVANWTTRWQQKLSLPIKVCNYIHAGFKCLLLQQISKYIKKSLIDVALNSISLFFMLLAKCLIVTGFCSCSNTRPLVILSLIYSLLWLSLSLFIFRTPLYASTW